MVFHPSVSVCGLTCGKRKQNVRGGVGIVKKRLDSVQTKREQNVITKAEQQTLDKKVENKNALRFCLSH